MYILPDLNPNYFPMESSKPFIPEGKDLYIQDLKDIIAERFFDIKEAE
jgi:hypothetical protein